MPDAIIITPSPTPNPHALKLTLNRTIAQRGETYRGDPAAAAAPWAAALLRIPGVVGVYGVNNFISISKDEKVSWDAIMPQADAALRQVFG